MKSEEHIPVLLNEVIKGVNPQNDDICVDATLGMAGHAKAVLSKIGCSGKLIGFDADAQSLEKAKIILKDFSSQVHFVHSNFAEIDTVLDELNIPHVQRIVADLGISSLHLDNVERGFSLRADGPLDMRMNTDQEVSAQTLVNSASEEELERIIREYGEERHSRRVAREIIRARTSSTIATTDHLKEIIMRAMPNIKGTWRIHPATRTFQAIRIAVNNELDVLKVFLEKCLKYLDSQGRLGVISFHSLEDRIVKHSFKKFSQEGLVDIITKKPIRPTEQEVKQNFRARSARLRIVEKK